MSHIHAVKDSDTNFKINPITRQVKNESSRKTTLIQYDHNSERFTFEIPRYVEFHDMALCNKAEIHYINIDQKTKEEKRGTYAVDDLRVKEDDSAAVVCSWLISNNATQYAGRLSFIVRYSCVENGKTVYAWNSAPASVDVSSGIDSGDYVVTEYADILEKWKAELFNAGYINAATMQTEISVLSARMDNFAKLPNGSTTGDAEVADLRVDFMGNSYETAGDAVRAQASRIADETTNFEKTITDFLTYGKNANFGWKIGELVTADGSETENNKRTRSNFLYAPKGTHFIFGGDSSELAGMYVFVYTVDKHYITNSGGYLPEYLANEDCYVRIVAKYRDEREIEGTGAFNNLVEMYFPETTRKVKRVSMNEWYIGALEAKHGGTIEEDSTKRAKSRFIYLEKNEQVKFDHSARELTGMFVFVYDIDKNYISCSGGYLYEYTALENCYIRLVSKYIDEREITNIGAFKNLVTIEYAKAPKSYVIGDFAKYFECGEFDGMTDTLPATKIDYIYGRYDALMAAHQEYITKNLLGYATAANGAQDTACPIYEYEIKADTSERPIEEAPTILIQTGIHGDEKSSVYGALLFFERMFESVDNVLADIRSGFNFKVIPLLNPYGYTNNVRTNARGVDVNRNFGFLWEENDSVQKGASPYSEFESQILRDWLAENKTAFMYVDYHNMGDYNPFISYINTPCEEMQKVYSNFIRRTTNKWRRRYHMDRKGSVYGWINNDKIPCTYNEAYYNANIERSCTLDIAWDENGVRYTERVIETSFEQLVNFIASMVDYIKRGT